MPEWKRIVRVGTPKVKQRPNQGPSAISISFKVRPAFHDDEWEKLFKKKAKELDIYPAFDSFVMDSSGGYVHANADELEKVVAALDEAIEYANDQYETTVLPTRQAEQQQRDKDAQAAKQLQADLDERASKLAKPDRPDLDNSW